MRRWLLTSLAIILLAAIPALGRPGPDSNYNVSAVSGGGSSIALDPNASSKATAFSSSGTTIAATISTSNAADCIYVDTSSLTGSGFGATIADTAGLTWTARTGSPYFPGGQTVNVWTAPAPSALTSDTITVTAVSALGGAPMTVFAISGCNTSSMFDSNLSAGLTTAAPDPASITTTNSNDMIIGICAGGSQSNPGAGAGFTLVKNGNFFGNEVKVVSTTQSSLSVVWSPSGDCSAGLADAIQQ